MPRAEVAGPGWTSWRRHDIVVDPIEFDTCPRLLGVGVGCGLPVCRWQGEYGRTLDDESVTDQKLCGEGMEKWVEVTSRSG